MTPKHENLAAQWTRLGASFSVPEASKTPDVEKLLIATADNAADNIRLLIMAVTWLCQYGNYVDVRRLVSLIHGHLEEENHPVMGLMLDWAQVASGSNLFDDAIRACKPATDHRPLSNIFRRTAAMASVAEKEATPLSRKWGRWMSDTKLRIGAIRPSAWVIQQNPTLRQRSSLASAKAHV